MPQNIIVAWEWPRAPPYRIMGLDHKLVEPFWLTLLTYTMRILMSPQLISEVFWEAEEWDHMRKNVDKLQDLLKQSSAAAVGITAAIPDIKPQVQHPSINISWHPWKHRSLPRVQFTFSHYSVIYLVKTPLSISHSTSQCLTHNTLYVFVWGDVNHSFIPLGVFPLYYYVPSVALGTMENTNLNGSQWALKASMCEEHTDHW